MLSKCLLKNIDIGVATVLLKYKNIYNNCIILFKIQVLLTDHY